MFDIDHFKNVNDTYGHDVGDTVLKNIVDTVNKNIRNIDIFVRWGGEEFIVLCPQTDSLSAATLAQKLRGAIDDASFDKVGNITCSFGVASFKDNESKDSLIKRSDDALYKAKDESSSRLIFSW
jgi:diguanylate cyclase (GGDEF)-like protein